MPGEKITEKYFELNMMQLGTRSLFLYLSFFPSLSLSLFFSISLFHGVIVFIGGTEGGCEGGGNNLTNPEKLQREYVK